MTTLLPLNSHPHANCSGDFPVNSNVVVAHWSAVAVRWIVVVVLAPSAPVSDLPAAASVPTR